LIGFAGAPLTLAIYAIEGKTTKEHHHFKQLLFSEPETVGKLIDLFAAQCADYLAMQVRAGADAVQIFDTWGGTVDPENYRRFVEPAHRRIIEAIKPLGVPIILFVKGGGPHMDRITATGADVVGLDWTLDMGEMAERYGRKASLQGNLDPTALLAPPQRVAALARPILEAGRKARGHIFNLGHGVLQMTPVESAAALVKTVGEFRYA
jgi:uroporphyrinogen decarboxylase